MFLERNMKVKNPYAKPEKVEFTVATHITQNIRFKLLSELLKDGFPTDLPTLAMLTSVLKDCDNTALNTKRVEGEASLTDVQASTFKTVNSILNTISANPFIKESNIDKIKNCTVPEYDFIEGEDAIGIDDTTQYLRNVGD